MKKWVFSAVAYLIAVVVVYYVVAGFAAKSPVQEQEHSETEQH